MSAVWGKLTRGEKRCRTLGLREELNGLQSLRRDQGSARSRALIA